MKEKVTLKLYLRQSINLQNPWGKHKKALTKSKQNIYGWVFLFTITNIQEKPYILLTTVFARKPTNYCRINESRSHISFC